MFKVLNCKTIVESCGKASNGHKVLKTHQQQNHKIAKHVIAKMNSCQTPLSNKPTVGVKKVKNEGVKA